MYETLWSAFQIQLKVPHTFVWPARKEIQKFDPFEILDVLPGASPSQIKRAYRKLSLSFHPDKNPDDPLAASRFIQITKAFQALTDEIAKRNWEKFGNPDGPQTTKVGIGLPRFLLENLDCYWVGSLGNFLGNQGVCQ